MMNTIRNIRYLSAITLIAFLFNAMLPFFAVYDLDNAKASELSDPSQKILICTGEGFKWISLEDLQSGKESPKQNKDLKCPLCYFVLHGKYTFTPYELATQSVFYSTPLLFKGLENRLAKTLFRSSPYSSRAPPHIA